jgi:hypothetical protein
MGTGSSDLRLCSRASSIRLSAGSERSHRTRRFQRAGGSLSRLHASGDHSLPLPEYSSQVRNRLFGGVFLEGRWYTFEARHNRRRIGRVLIGLGRDGRTDYNIIWETIARCFSCYYGRDRLAAVSGLTLQQPQVNTPFEVAGARSYNSEHLH